MSAEREPGPLTSRREALRLLGAQMALIVAGCSKPPEEIVPYVRMPERLVPGVPLQFATALPLAGYGRGVLCTSIEGRPIKAEGNPLHPASLGATDVFAEAAVLSLYDPDRSQTVRQAGEISGWEAFAAALLPRLDALAAQVGEGLRLLTGRITSPTLLRQIGSLRQRYPKFIWHMHDPAGERGGPRRLDARLRPDAHLAAALRRRGCDRHARCRSTWSGPVADRECDGFAQRRRVRREGAAMSRLYAIEIAPTLTGANADHCLPRPLADIVALAIAMARAMGADLADPQLPAEEAHFAETVTRDLSAHPGRAMVLAGASMPADIQALCHWINERLGAPIDLIKAPGGSGPIAPFADLVRDLGRDQVDSLVIAGCNPAYDAPPEFGFAKAAAKAKFRVHLGLYVDETAALCDWHIPDSHRLRAGPISLPPTARRARCNP